MSLIGAQTGIVSLGSSCQPAHQLMQHASLISERLGEELLHDRYPLDWVICPIGKVTEWLRSGDWFPRSPDDLTPVPEDSAAYLWPERSVYFWHDFRSSGGDLAGTFRLIQGEYERGFAKLRELHALKRVLIVVANTQNNLPLVLGPAYADLGFDFTAANVSDLKFAFEAFLGRRCEMLCVTYAERSSDALHGMRDQDIAVARIPRDDSEWQGDDAVWRQVLLEYFRAE
jgi:hypothetical protein